MIGKKRQLKKIEKTETFLLKLFEIMKNKSYNNIINWNEDGTCIIIKDINLLSKKILPKYYKHDNYSSFVRQLNMYNFHKLRTSKKKTEQVFKNEKFNNKITIENIKKIKRKISNDNETLNEIKQEEKKDNNINTVINYLLTQTKNNAENQKKLQDKINDLSNQNNFLLKKIEKNTQIQNEYFYKTKGLALCLINYLFKLHQHNKQLSRYFCNDKNVGKNLFKNLIINLLKKKYKQVEDDKNNNNIFNINKNYFKINNINNINKNDISIKKNENIVEKGDTFSINNNLDIENNFFLDSYKEKNKLFNDYIDNKSFSSIQSKNIFDIEFN